MLGDPHEGTITRPLHKMRTETFNKLVKGEVAVHFSNLTREARQGLFASCWNLSPNESEALWRLYAGATEGVAIQTTYQSLVGAIDSDDRFFIGKITYIDYDSEMFPHGNFFYPAMHKRRAFSYENEVRLIRSDFEFVSEGTPPAESHRLGIDLETLVHAIYVNPYSPAWYADTIRWIVAKTSPSLAEKVHWSKMKAEPLY